MTTGKDFGLPAEYHDWVINDGKRKVSDFDDYVMVTANRHRGNAVTYIPLAQLFPPKPKPTLPDLGMGGVMSYTNTCDERMRVMRIPNGYWVDDTGHRWPSADVLHDVNDDGFTVELDGL